MPILHHAFISYSRKDSKSFAIQLHDQLTQLGFKIWLDLNEMPPAAQKFPNDINEAIEKSQNFIFIVTPEAVKSEYCYAEIDYAAKFKKRIIPVNYIDTRDDKECKEKLHPILKLIDTLFCRQDKLANGKLAFEEPFAKLVSALRRQADYVEQHTRILVAALQWHRNQKKNSDLLIGEQRQQAIKWLEERFTDGQPPCEPTDLHCEYICQSTINANNLMTQVFICYPLEDKAFMRKLGQTLMRHHITVWWNKAEADYQTMTVFQEEVKEAIEEADNFIYLISAHSVPSFICQQQLEHAYSRNKRIIALTLAEVDYTHLSKIASAWQRLDFTKHDNEEHYHASANQLLQQLHENADYYEQHKHLLVKALKWQRRDYNHSLLLRGYNLEKFEVWLKTAQLHQIHKPLSLQEQFIKESYQHQQFAVSALDVFISYSQADADFARNLNNALQDKGKTTWFDQESIAVGADFQQEIHRGIEQCDNFLFIISPKSIQSPYCDEEVKYAHNFKKRIITVLHQAVNPSELPEGLQHIEWLDFNRYRGNFLTNFNELLRVLDIDREHARSYTKWMQKALEWSRQGKSADLLLRGNEFANAKAWLQQAQQKQPTPTHLQKAFIDESEYAIHTAKNEIETEIQQQVAARTSKLTEQLSTEQLNKGRLQKLLIASGILGTGVVQWD